MIRNFKNKNVLITGGSLGLGYELSNFFLDKGANLIICSRSKKNLKIAQKKLEKKLVKNQKFFIFKADISNQKDTKKLYNQVLKKFKHLDVLISNAGVYGPKGFLLDVNWNEWKKGFEINFFGSVNLIKNFIF